MLKILNSLSENPFLNNCPSTVFTVLLDEEVSQNPQFSKLKTIQYTHGLLKYPRKWENDDDLFCYLSLESIKLLQDKKIFFVFDASTEGFSTIHDFPFFDVLYYNCKKYNVDPDQIIYVSSNLKDEENIKTYCTDKNLKTINVCCFVSFEQASRKLLSIENEIKECHRHFQGKYFSSLSRINRVYRSMATFTLCQDEISSKALISHDRVLKKIDNEHWRNRHFLQEYSIKCIKRWRKSLPLIVDKEDFNDNWALTYDYYNIHRQTLFQIVNETLVDNYNNTSLFYSEKTFRPIICYQPFVIYGQKDCNKHLKNIGYQLYDEWFDLSFDSEEDNVLRYKKLLLSVKETCRYLDSLKKESQIEWRFKNQELLKNNFLTMIASKYSREKIKGLLENLANKIN
jgi:hypothetical protein